MKTARELYFEKIKLNNMGLDDPRKFDDLDAEIQANMLKWIGLNISKRNSYNRYHSSYGLKRLLPFYVYNGEFKGAMLKAGYKVLDKDARNWNFNLYLKKNSAGIDV